MDRLPPEILDKIFIQLDLQQRLICSVVCHDWWSVFDKCSLFYNVTINGDEEMDQFNLIMDMFTQLPDRAAQVEVLNLTLKAGFVFNRKALLNLFPNARTIIVETTVPNSTSTPCFFPEPVDITSSKPKLKHLADFYHCDLTSQVLQSNLGGQLESLYLDFRWLSGIPAILFLLKDLPLLKKLSLLSPIITLIELEQIHTNIPSIQDFVLKEINLEGGSMPSDIIPAASITKLDFCTGYIGDVETHTQLYQYMIKKYINITNIEYRDDALGYFYDHERRQIYLNGFLDFLRLIGPYKSQLALSGLPDEIDAIEILDSVNAQVTELCVSVCDGGTVFKYIAQSQQSKYIEKVDIVDTRINCAHHIKSLQALTTLSVQSREYPPPLYLVDCLNICSSTLKHLQIECYHLIVAPFKTQLESIQTLDMSFVQFTKDLGDIISSCFPNLVDLTLKGKVSKNLNIVLKNPRFQKATFAIGSIMIDKSYKYGFSFKAPSLAKTQYYICGTKDATRVQQEDLDDLPVLSIETFTEKKLKVDCDIEIH